MFVRSAVALAWLLALAAPASADLIWGINGHPITAYPGVSPARQLDYLKDLGLRQYRVNISDEAGSATLATLVEEGRMRGIAIVPVLTPGVDLDRDTPEELYAKARSLAVRLASRFRNDIRVWELGNEMENYAIITACEMRDDGSQYPCTWGPAGGLDRLDYYGPRWAKVSAVLKGLSDGVVAVDPTIRKAIGTAGWGHLGAFERMRDDGIRWDISVWHMYGEDPEPAFRTLSGYGKPIWITEFNDFRGSEQEQAEALRRTMIRLRALQARYDVEAAQIYELLDETYWAPSPEASMGLVRLVPGAKGGWAAGEPKPAYAAVRELIRGPLPFPGAARDCGPVVEAASGASRQVRSAYCLLLGRQGDPKEVERWAREIANGSASILDVMALMAGSDEFRERYGILGMTDRAYIAFLFHLLLGRNVDGHGLESYASALGTGAMTREAVADGIIRSGEFRLSRAALFETGATTDEPQPAQR